MTAIKIRVFVVGAEGTELREFNVSPKLDAAMDILSDANMLDEKRVRSLIACERDLDGPWAGDCEAFARKLAYLGRALRDSRKKI